MDGRVRAISSMLVGGLIGAVLALRVSRLAPLAVAALVLLMATVVAHIIARKSSRAERAS